MVLLMKIYVRFICERQISKNGDRVGDCSDGVMVEEEPCEEVVEA